MRPTLGKLYAATARLPVWRWLAEKQRAADCNVVLIHYCGNPVPPHFAALTPGRLDPAALAADLAWLERRFRFVSLDEAVAGNHDAGGNRPSLALTIDDGLDCLDDHVLEILDRYRVRPCLFLITGCTGNTRLMWRHKLSAIIRLTESSRLQEGLLASWPGADAPASAAGLLRRNFSMPANQVDAFTDRLWEACGMPAEAEYLATWRPYLSWERAAELQSAGFGIGSHSHTHPRFDLLDSDAAIAEMRTSRALLDRHLGPAPRFFAYPFGHLPDRRRRADVHRAGGYSAYFGTFGFSRRGSPPAGLLQRISIDDSVEAVDRAPLYRALARVQRLRGRHNPRI